MVGMRALLVHDVQALHSFSLPRFFDVKSRSRVKLRTGIPVSCSIATQEQASQVIHSRLYRGTLLMDKVFQALLGRPVSVLRDLPYLR